MSSETLHEAAEVIGPAVIDRHRAIVSLMEELEAVDWYDQRVAATQRPLAGRHPRPQPGRGEGARGDGARVAAPPRRRARQAAAHLPVHRGAGDRGRGDAEAADGAAGGPSDGSLGIGSLKGRSWMNHLLRELAPDHRGRVGVDRGRGEDPPDDPPGRPQARRLRGPARLVVLGHQPRPRRGGRPARRRDRGPAAPGAPAGRAPGALLAQPGASSTTPPAGATDLDWSGLEEAAFRIGEAENAAVFNGYERAGIVGIAGASSHGPIPVGRLRQLPDRGRHGRQHAARRRASAARTGWPSAPPGTPASSRRPSTAATCCSTTSARSWAGRSCGRPASTARSC